MAVNSVEDLEVFKLAHSLVLNVYEVTRSFPREETFGLVTQWHRGAASVVANLAEGAGRPHRAEYQQFAGIARGSAAETSDHLLLARDLGYIPPDDSDKLRQDYSRVGQRLTGALSAPYTGGVGGF
jgi:four helix bundle protein